MQHCAKILSVVKDTLRSVLLSLEISVSIARWNVRNVLSSKSLSEQVGRHGRQNCRTALEFRENCPRRSTDYFYCMIFNTPENIDIGNEPRKVSTRWSECY